MSKHPKNTGASNLREPWKPGECGNPKGRPRGSVNLLQRIREKLLELPEGDRQALADAAAEAYAKAMAHGDIRHIQDFLDRDEGKPTQPIDLNGALEIQTITPQEAIQRQAEALQRASLVRPVLAVPKAPGNGNGNGNGRNGHR